jgi:hypothetical protein
MKSPNEDPSAADLGRWQLLQGTSAAADQSGDRQFGFRLLTWLIVRSLGCRPLTAPFSVALAPHCEARRATRHFARVSSSEIH